MTINPSDELNRISLLSSANNNSSMSSSRSLSLQDLSSSVTTMESGDASLTPSRSNGKPTSLPQHELNEIEDFSETSEDLFAPAAVAAANNNNNDKDTSSNLFVHSNGSSSGFEDVNFGPHDSNDFFFASRSEDLNDNEEDEESWASGYNDYNDEDEDYNNSWISKEGDGDDGADSNLLKRNSAPAGIRLSIAKRKAATGPLVWVCREGIDGMEQAARLVLPLAETNSSFEEDEHVEIQWRNDGSFDWVSTEDIRLVKTDSSLLVPATPPPREEMVRKFHNSDLSMSDRRIMRTQDNIITSDAESSESSESSEGSVEDEEEVPTLGRKLGNMMGFRSSGSPVVPKRSSSSNHKKDPSSAGATPARKRSLPAIPFSSPLGRRRSNSLGKSRTPPPPPITAGDAIDGGDGKRSSSFHHEQRRARKGTKKQAFKSRSADSMPAEMEDSPIIVQAKSLSNSAHTISNPSTPPTPSKQQIKASSYHHDQRNKARKGGKKKAVKSRSTDAEPEELIISPSITEAKSLWQQMKKSSSPSPLGGKNKPSYHHEQRKARKGGKKKAAKSRSADTQPEELMMSPTIAEAKSLWKEMHASSPDMAFSQNKKTPLSYHHEQRTLRKGGKRKVGKSRSADSQPTEMLESPVIAEAKKSLSNSMHNLIKPESMKAPSYHHEQRRAKRGAKAKQKKSRSADSMPVDSTIVTIEPLSMSTRSQGEHTVPRRKRSLSQGLKSPVSLLKRGLSAIKTTNSPKHSPNSRLKDSVHSDGIPSADFLSPEQVSKKRSARKSESNARSPRSKRNTSLRRSEGDVSISPTNGGVNKPSRPSSINKRKVVVDLMNPKRNSSIKRNDAISDTASVTPRRNSSFKRSDASPRRSSSLKRTDASPRRSSSFKRTDTSPRRNSSLRSKSPNSGLAYLQKKQKSPQQAPSRRSGASALLSSTNKGNDDEPRRRVANVDSAIFKMTGNRSTRQLDGIGDNPGRKRVSNVDSAILLMKKQSSQRKLDAAGGEMKKDRKVSTKADSALAVIKKKKSPKQSAASRLLGTSNDIDLPSPPIKSDSGRQYRSSGNLMDEGDQDFNNSYMTRADKLQISPNQAKRANAKSKFEALNDKMSLTIGVEASPDMRLRKRNSTLREKRAASKESRKKLTNAFQRMIQPDGTEKTADDDSNDLEVPMNN